MRFLLRKTAAGPYRSRLSFCYAKRHSAWSTAIAGNSGFLFSLIRQSRIQELILNDKTIEVTFSKALRFTAKTGLSFGP